MDGADVMAFSLVSPFPESDIPLFWQWFQENQGAMMDDQCPKTIEELAAKNKRDLENGALTFGVMSNGKCVERSGRKMAAMGSISATWYSTRLCRRKTSWPRRAKDCFHVRKGREEDCLAALPRQPCFRHLPVETWGYHGRLLATLDQKKGNVADLILMASFPEDFA
jgi:hypothetical protein